MSRTEFSASFLKISSKQQGFTRKTRKSSRKDVETSPLAFLANCVFRVSVSLYLSLQTLLRNKKQSFETHLGTPAIETENCSRKVLKPMSNQRRIDVKSMPNRPLTRGGRGGFEGGVWGAVPNKPLTKLAKKKQVLSAPKAHHRNR